MATMRATITTINRAPKRDYAAALARELTAATYQHGQRVLAAALPLTPVETGYLRASGYVSAPVVTNGHVAVTIGFGAYYAIYVHEILSARHPVGQAKFLEQPALALSGEFAQAAAAAVVKAFA